MNMEGDPREYQLKRYKMHCGFLTFFIYLKNAFFNEFYAQVNVFISYGSIHVSVLVSVMGSCRMCF